MSVLFSGARSHTGRGLAILALVVCGIAAPALAQPVVTPSAASIDFGGESMTATSLPRTLTIQNTGNAVLNISALGVSNAQFAISGTCTAIAPGGGCTVQLTFTPALSAGALNSTVPVSGALTITSNAATSPNSVPLAGTAEKSLVSHYYQAILTREPDAGGKTFWSSEATRVATTLGGNVNETWYAMAISFFSSAEYLARARDNTGFVTDLYLTFFNRAPDAGGLSYWLGQIGGGMPREVALASFLFSTEFTTFSQNIFGNTAVRKEIDTVMDFYRGILARLPDNSGMAFWQQQFRTAQCQGAAAVAAQADSISGLFLNSAEYTGRNRTNSQFVGDLYNAFLRRGGDLPGVQFWINALNTSQQSREQVRKAFVASPEFQARVQAVVAEGCFTPPPGAGSLRVSVGGFGLVTASPATISCGSVPAATSASSTKCFQSGLSGTVTLTATPFSSAFQFAGWAGDTTCTTNPSCPVDMGTSRWVKAKFTPVANGNPCTGLGLVSDKANHPLNANYPALAIGQSFTDPNFGTTIRKLTDVRNDGRANNLALVPVYSTISAWNADESLMILYRTSGVASGVHELFNGKTYAFIRTLDDLPWADVEQIYWDTTDPNIIYSFENNNFYKYDVSKPAGQRLTTIRSFTATCGSGKSIYGGSDPFFSSWDSKVFGLACTPSGAVFSYNPLANTLGTLSPLSEPRADTSDGGPQAAPSGTKLFMNVPSSGTNLVRIYDLNMTRGAFLDMGSGDEHGASNRLFNGDDTYNSIQFDPGPSGTDVGTLVQWNMNGTPNASNRIPGRIIIGPATGYPYPPTGTHVGGTSFNRTGLVVVSTKGAYTGATLLDNELMLVDSDVATNPANSVCRIGHNRTKSEDYWAEPHPSISPSGTRIVFGSSWGGTADPATVNSYVVELPGYKP